MITTCVKFDIPFWKEKEKKKNYYFKKLKILFSDTFQTILEIFSIEIILNCYY